MENHFAGANDPGHRRRRRLASSDDLDKNDAPDAPEESRFVEPAPVNSVASPREVQLLRRIISPRRWKHVTVLLLLLGCISLLLSTPASVLSDATETAGIPTARILHSTSAVMLMLSAQMSMLIGWVRSGSEVDFQGRYRWWKWFSVGLMATAAVTMTETAVLLPTFMSFVFKPILGPVQSARHAVTFVPLAGYVLVVLARVIPDMKRCRQSQLLLMGGLTLAAAGMLLKLTGNLHLVGSPTFHAIPLFASYLVLAAMLIHSHFVIYINNAPPQITTTTSSATISRDISWPESQQDEVPETPADVAIEAESTPEQKQIGPTKKPRSRKSRRQKKAA